MSACLEENRNLKDEAETDDLNNKPPCDVERWVSTNVLSGFEELSFSSKKSKQETISGKQCCIILYVIFLVDSQIEYALSINR